MSVELRPLVDLAMDQGATYAELRYQSDIYESNLLKNGLPEVSSHDIARGVAARVLVDGALAFGATDRMGKGDHRDLVARTVRSARAAARRRDRPITMSDAELGTGEFEVKPRVPFSAVSLEGRLELLKEADDAALDAAGRCRVGIPGRYLSLDTFVSERHVVTSDGADVRSIVPRVEVHVMLTASEPQKGSVQRMFSIGESAGWEAAERWDLPRRLTEEVTSLGSIIHHAVRFSPETTDVVLGPEVTGIVAHESAGHPGEADRMLGREAAQAGETYLSPLDIGKVVGSPQVNVVDDPTLPRSFGFYHFDEEGVRARRRYLIREGRIDELLHNRETGSQFGVSSNGASRAVAYNREPIVRMANTFVEPRDHSVEEMIEGVRHGVYLKNFMEWNIDDRRYNQRYVGLEAYRIEDGRIGQRLKNPVLEITTPALWSAVDAVGKDLQFSSAHCGKGDPMQAIPVWTGGPHLRLRNVRVGGSA
mgnify:CR=1 FL=1